MTTGPVCVVGAGPAGSMAALGLSAAGVACQLLERNTDPKDKVCGEFLSPEAVARLDALSFPWLQAGATPVRHVRIESHGATVGMPLPFEALSVSRCFLDAWLLGQAKGRGVDVQTGVHVKEVVRTETAFELRTSDGGLQVKTLVLATGKQALGRFHPRTGADGASLVGWKMNFDHVGAALAEALRETLGLFFFDGGYGGISVVGEGTLTVSLLVLPTVLVQSGDEPLGLLRAIAPGVPLLQLVLRESQPVWDRPKTVSNLPYGHCDEETQAGLFPVGDQFAVLPSFTGTGISFAMASGSLAAEHIAAGLPACAYAVEARAMARKVLRRALPLHRWLPKPAFARVAMWALRWAPPLLPWVARTTRVPVLKKAKSAT